MVAKLCAAHIKRRRAEAFGCARHLMGGNKVKLGIPIYKLADEPGASDAIYLDLLSCYPLHVLLSFHLQLQDHRQGDLALPLLPFSSPRFYYRPTAVCDWR